MDIFDAVDQAAGYQWWTPFFGMAVMGLILGLWLYESRKQ